METLQRLNIANTTQPRLKTLYLTGYGVKLSKKQERFMVTQEGETIQHIPVIHVHQIILFGTVQLTTQIMQYCLKENIPIYFLSRTGKYQGMLDKHSTNAVQLQRQQYHKSEDSVFCLQIAQQFIHGKISNTRLLLQRLKRSQPEHELVLQTAIKHLNIYIKQINTSTYIDELLGIEGIAARTYFQTLANIIPKQWHFSKRNKYPPKDPVNALLSFGYALLFQNTYSFIKIAGLNPHIAYLHRPRQGHPALASDLMEEFRSVIVDAVVFNLIFNNKLNPDDFELATNEKESCYIKPHARKIFIQQIENKFNSAIRHPVTGLKIDYRRCIEHQTKHLAQLIRDDNNETSEAYYQAAIFR